VHRNQILEVLHEHLKCNLNTLENQMTLQTIDFVKANKDCFNNDNLPGHITGSAFILNKSKDKALFTLHKKLNKWLQLGGHSDGNSDIFQTVIREAKEESGIQEINFLQKELFDVDIHEIPKSKKMVKHLHFDLRFLLIAESSKFKISEESILLKWIPLEKISEFNNEQSILRMVDKLF